MSFGNAAPAASVLVGLVDPGESFDLLLRALEAQEGSVPFEVVIASRCGPGVAAALRERDRGIVVVEAEPGTPLPELRRRALETARGRFVLVTEDHTVPPRGWVEGLVRALERSPERVAAAGGLVDNALRERAADWAAFLCEYHAYLPPNPPALAGTPGETRDVPGMNVAYRREALGAAERSLLGAGFWEATLHPELLRAGRTFLSLPGIVVAHRKVLPFRSALAQRYHYSRAFAGSRFPARAYARRAAFAVGSALLPPLVLWRIARSVAARPAYRSALLRSLPALACLALAWGAGEAVGYALGAGKSLERVE
jgi:hypothetical protein